MHARCRPARSAPRWNPPGLEEGGKEETKGEGREREQSGGRTVYAFLSSRGFVCNNLCGETA